MYPYVWRTLDFRPLYTSIEELCALWAYFAEISG